METVSQEGSTISAAPFPPVGDGENEHRRSADLDTLKGRAFPLCPGSSDVDLLGYRDSVIYLDAQVSHGALDLGVTEKELNGTQIPCAPVDQGSLGPPQRVSAVQMRVESDAGEPLGQKPRILTG